MATDTTDYGPYLWILHLECLPACSNQQIRSNCSTPSQTFQTYFQGIRTDTTMWSGDRTDPPDGFLFLYPSTKACWVQPGRTLVRGNRTTRRPPHKNRKKKKKRRGTLSDRTTRLHDSASTLPQCPHDRVSVPRHCRHRILVCWVFYPPPTPSRITAHL